MPRSSNVKVLSATIGHGPDPLAGLQSKERRVLRQLARFGFLTVSQLAHLVANAQSTIAVALHRLNRRGLVRRFAPAWGKHRMNFYALSVKGQRLMHTVPDIPPLARAQLDRLDEIAAAADLAMWLEAQGHGRWLTWAEYGCRHLSNGGAPFPILQVPPAGVLEEPSGRLQPVWLLLRPRSPGKVRNDLASVCLTDPFAFGTVYALPELTSTFDGFNLPADVQAWTPPHLGGRRPLLPGWWKPLAGDHRSRHDPARPRGARVPSTRPNLGPAATDILQYLDRFGHATTRQVARAGRRQAPIARGILFHLLKLGLVQVHGEREPPPEVWSATRTGLAVIGSRRTPVRANPLHGRHSFALNDLAHQLTAQTGGAWETERDVRTREVGVRSPHSAPPPDGRLTLPDATRVCIQLQLSTGDTPGQLLAAHTFRGLGLCEEVWFVCAPRVAPSYRRALRPGDAGLIWVLEWTAPDHTDSTLENRSGPKPRATVDLTAVMAGRPDLPGPRPLI